MNLTLELGGRTFPLDRAAAEALVEELHLVDVGQFGSSGVDHAGELSERLRGALEGAGPRTVVVDTDEQAALYYALNARLASHELGEVEQEIYQAVRGQAD
jgi:hypothetical protein